MRELQGIRDVSVGRHANGQVKATIVKIGRKSMPHERLRKVFSANKNSGLHVHILKPVLFLSYIFISDTGGYLWVFLS